MDGLTPLEGGWSGETFLADAGAGPSVVRIFAPDRHRAEAPEIQAALLRLMRGLLPVPQVLEVRAVRADADVPGLLVTEFLGGVRGDLVLPTLDAAGLRRVGEQVGSVAAILGGMPTLRGGLWADRDLAIEPFEASTGGWLEKHAVALRGHGWSAADLAALAVLAEEADGLLAELDRTCVVHSDLNPKNLLVDPETLRVTGVVDWEFCHAGHPWTDLGNQLRFDREPAYVDAVLGVWVDRHGGQPADVRRGAAAADVVALIELASREGANPVTARAADLLRAIVASGDLLAD